MDDALLPLSNDGQKPAASSATRLVRGGIDGQPLSVVRYDMSLETTPWRSGGAPLQFLPPHCVLLTDMPALLASLGPLPPDLVVLSTQPARGIGAEVHHLRTVDETSVAARIRSGTRHVRVLTKLDWSELGRAVRSLPDIAYLHTLTFLALKRCHGRLDSGSFLTLLLNAFAKNILHPNAGLFSGLVKVVRVEVPPCRSLTVCTATSDPRLGVAQIEHESGAHKLAPLVAISGSRRMTPCFADRTCDFAASLRPRRKQNPVVVVFGDRRGNIARAMNAPAADKNSRMYMIGSSSLDEATDAPDSERSQERTHKEFSRSKRVPALTIHHTHEPEQRVDPHVTPGKVETTGILRGGPSGHYFQADPLDVCSVRQAVECILERESHVDLVINGAGLHCSSTVQVKSLDNFLAVRDAKIRSYWNLRAAFGSVQPLVWYNFGSYTGSTGQLGESDYASASDFLVLQARWNRIMRGEDEFMASWTMGQAGPPARPFR